MVSHTNIYFYFVISFKRNINKLQTVCMMSLCLSICRTIQSEIKSGGADANDFFGSFAENFALSHSITLLLVYQSSHMLQFFPCITIILNFIDSVDQTVHMILYMLLDNQYILHPSQHTYQKNYSVMVEHAQYLQYELYQSFLHKVDIL